MKAWTLWQPHASPVVLGLKKWETRPRRVNYRGPVAIHAGLNKKTSLLAWREPFYSALAPLHTTVHGKQGIGMPYGCIIGIVDIVDCQEIVGVVNGAMGPVKVPVYKAELENGETIRGNEFFFGHYEIGRFAIQLANPRRIEPVLARGMQGLWNWEPNAQVIRIR